MIQRCTNPKSKSYENYGGRGIKVCDRWLTFKNFLEDMGEPPPGQTLDRIDNEGDYEPENCKWSTYEEQSVNSRSSMNISIDGVDYPTLKAAAIAFGIKPGTARVRLFTYGWDIEKALRTPVDIKKRKRGFSADGNV